MERKKRLTGGERKITAVLNAIILKKITGEKGRSNGAALPSRLSCPRCVMARTSNDSKDPTMGQKQGLMEKWRRQNIKY